MDSKHANYSYGDLQKVLKKGLRYIGKEKLQKCKNILLLGVAGGSVIETLIQDFKVTSQITGIEIDETTLSLAKKYFNLSNYKQVDLITADAFQYVKTTKNTFDLIIIDIFNDDKMPKELFAEKTWVEIHKILNNNGLCVFNSIVTSRKDVDRNNRLINYLKIKYTTTHLIKTHINELFILEK